MSIASNCSERSMRIAFISFHGQQPHPAKCCRCLSLKHYACLFGGRMWNRTTNVDPSRPYKSVFQTANSHIDHPLQRLHGSVTARFREPHHAGTSFPSQRFWHSAEMREHPAGTALPHRPVEGRMEFPPHSPLSKGPHSLVHYTTSWVFVQESH